MNQPITIPAATNLLVRKTIHVATSPERAFRVFTEQVGTWWPLVTHHIGKADAQTCVMEPFAGGRWYERGVDGSECLWGHVLAWDPPARLVLSWEISAQWAHDPNLHTEVEVCFTRDSAGTRVELEHRLLERFGDHAAQMHQTLGGPGGWSGLLDAFAGLAAA